VLCDPGSWGSPLFVAFLGRVGGLPLPPDKTPTHVSSCGLFVIYTGLRILPEGWRHGVKKREGRWRGLVQGRQVDEEICHTLGWGFRNPDFR
jgi:hypothetical protein